MINIYYPAKNNKIGAWASRLDNSSLAYNLIEEQGATIPRLVDGDKVVEGIPDIETYIENLEQFVKGWYEDRCDRHDFDPDAQTPDAQS